MINLYSNQHASSTITHKCDSECKPYSGACCRLVIDIDFHVFVVIWFSFLLARPLHLSLSLSLSFSFILSFSIFVISLLFFNFTNQTIFLDLTHCFRFRTALLIARRAIHALRCAIWMFFLCQALCPLNYDCPHAHTSLSHRNANGVYFVGRAQ